MRASQACSVLHTQRWLFLNNLSQISRFQQSLKLFYVALPCFIFLFLKFNIFIVYNASICYLKHPTVFRTYYEWLSLASNGARSSMHLLATESTILPAPMRPPQTGFMATDSSARRRMHRSLRPAHDDGDVIAMFPRRNSCSVEQSPLRLAARICK